MKSVTFPQANCELAKDQPEYETLHTFVEQKTVPSMGPREVPWSHTACFELSPEEIAEIVKTGKLWYTQMVFGNSFHPIRMSTQSPFE